MNLIDFAKRLTADQQVTVEENRPLVYSTVKKYFGRLPRTVREDLEDEAKLALIRATIKYNPDLGWKYSTYVVASILNACLRFAQRRMREMATST